jgi:hypothetical protein
MLYIQESLPTAAFKSKNKMETETSKEARKEERMNERQRSRNKKQTSNPRTRHATLGRHTLNTAPSLRNWTRLLAVLIIFFFTTAPRPDTGLPLVPIQWKPEGSFGLLMWE